MILFFSAFFLMPLKLHDAVVKMSDVLFLIGPVSSFPIRFWFSFGLSLLVCFGPDSRSGILSLLIRPGLIFGLWLLVLLRSIAFCRCLSFSGFTFKPS